MKALWLRLILPLAVCAALAFYINTRLSLDGLFINLSATFIGIALTVSYVDWILRMREAERWRSTDMRIASRLTILLNSTLSGIRAGLGFNVDILDFKTLQSGDLLAAHKEIVRIAQQIISPSLHKCIASLDQKGWQTLAFHMTNAHNGILSFLGAFQSRLDPKQICDLLDLQDSLAKSMISYKIFPELLGVPVDRLPTTTTPPQILQAFGINETANDLARVITLAASLSNSIAKSC